MRVCGGSVGIVAQVHDNLTNQSNVIMFPAFLWLPLVAFCFHVHEFEGKADVVRAAEISAAEGKLSLVDAERAATSRPEAPNGGQMETRRLDPEKLAALVEENEFNTVEQKRQYDTKDEGSASLQAEVSVDGHVSQSNSEDTDTSSPRRSSARSRRAAGKAWRSSVR